MEVRVFLQLNHGSDIPSLLLYFLFQNKSPGPGHTLEERVAQDRNARKQGLLGVILEDAYHITGLQVHLLAFDKFMLI